MQVLASLSGWHPQLSAAELKALLPHTEITSTSSPRIVGLHSLENQEILYGNKKIKFKLENEKKKRLLEGLDNIGISMKKTSSIDEYEEKLKKDKPWI